MNILVIGAGAVGIGLAASLASQDASVSIYARGETARTIRKNGIRRVGLFEHIEIENIQVYEDYNEIPESNFDYIIIASKTTANENNSDNLNNHSNI